MLTDRIDIFMCAPHNDLLSNREQNEAYCLANPDREYAVYFPDGGEVTLDISRLRKPATLTWLNILKSRWMDVRQISEGSKIKLACPSRDYWALLIKKSED